MALFGTTSKDPGDKKRRTAQAALFASGVETVRRAINENPDINLNAPHPKKGYSPLAYALVKKRYDVMQLLLDAGANPTYGGVEKPEMLRQYAYGKYDIRALEMLLAAGTEIEVKDYYLVTPLYYMAERGNKAEVELLLKAGATEGARRHRYSGSTASEIAEANGQFDLAAAIRNHCRTQEGALKTVAALLPPASVKSDEREWVLTASDEVACVSEKKGTDYKLTELFNFGTGTYHSIIRNKTTNAESHLMRQFEEFASLRHIDKAYETYTRLGGVLPAPEYAARTIVKPQVER